jgi:hypothetical protein
MRQILNYYERPTATQEQACTGARLHSAEHLKQFNAGCDALPNKKIVQARQYRNDVWPMFSEFVETEWLPNHAYRYFKSRDAIALNYLPKLIASKKQ